MSKRSYQRLLNRLYTNFKRAQFHREQMNDLDAVLALPHPEREIAFVAWASPAGRSEIFSSPNSLFGTKVQAVEVGAPYNEHSHS